MWGRGKRIYVYITSLVHVIGCGLWLGHYWTKDYRKGKKRYILSETGGGGGEGSQLSDIYNAMIAYGRR